MSVAVNNMKKEKNCTIIFMGFNKYTKYYILIGTNITCLNALNGYWTHTKAALDNSSVVVYFINLNYILQSCPS